MHNQSERIIRAPKHGASNFDRAVTRMQQQGLRPFCPDSNTGAAPRRLHGDSLTPDLAASAARMDALIAAFLFGAALGWFVGAHA